MSILNDYIRRKLSVKVSLWVVLFAAVIFLTALGFLFYQAREAVHRESVNRAMQILDNTSMRVSAILNRAEVATLMTEWLVMRHPDTPDSMFVYSKGILLHNPELDGCSIAFEPNHFKDKGRYFSVYSQQEGDTILSKQEGNDQYEYFYMDWYQQCHLLDQPCWTEPYLDEDDYNKDGLFSDKIIASYCRPLKNKDGKFIGTIATDISLDWLSKTILAVKPYPNSYSLMIGRGGTYFVHPDSTKLFYQTIYTETLENPDTARTALGQAMQRGEEGMKHMIIDGEECHVFYKPLGQTGWSMAIVCPESDIFDGIKRLHRAIMLIITIGLLLMLYVFIRVITNELKPLRQLVKETETIASGDFNAPMPEFNRKDEIGQLSHSFGNMQASLVNYIEELKKTTAQKATIESELHVAKEIQMSMIPDVYPPYPERDDIDVFGQLLTAKEVGGDLFDFFIRDEKLFFCVGDVSGKGIPASLVMAVIFSQLRTIAAHEAMPDRIITELNEAAAAVNESNMFVTLFFGVLDLLTGRMRYCNAGHDVPILIGSGTGFLPCDANIPVGVMAGWKYTLQEANIDPHTTIFLYTDGLTEAEDIEHNQFQEQRILDVIHSVSNAPQQLIKAMTEAVHQFVGDAEQSDDLTMLAIQYKHEQPNVRYQRSLTLPNDVQTISQLAEFTDIVCETAGLDMMLSMQMNLALEEAVVNVMNYAYPAGVKGTVNIDATITDKGLKFVISDSGTPFDPTAKSEVDTTLSAEERNIGGLGIHLIRQIMDSINYEYVDGRNVLTLLKKI